MRRASRSRARFGPERREGLCGQTDGIVALGCGVVGEGAESCFPARSERVPDGARARGDSGTTTPFGGGPSRLRRNDLRPSGAEPNDGPRVAPWPAGPRVSDPRDPRVGAETIKAPGRASRAPTGRFVESSAGANSTTSREAHRGASRPCAPRPPRCESRDPSPTMRASGSRSRARGDGVDEDGRDDCRRREGRRASRGRPRG